jgi:hypothetical protein
MSLTKEDLQIIEEIVRIKVKNNLNKYVLKKPHVLNITYDELEAELIKVGENTPDIPVNKLE